MKIIQLLCFFTIINIRAQLIEKAKNIKVELVMDSILKPYCYFTEIKITPTDTILLKNIQTLSENKKIISLIPEERLKTKIALFKNCKDPDISVCEYIPEGYKIVTNKNNLLTIQYAYNAYMNPDEYFKYAVFNLVTGKQITYEQMFKKPSDMAEIYNAAYISKMKRYINRLNKNDEEELEQYNTYTSHLASRIPFGLEDLNTIEIVYDITTTTKIKFHYNGMGGNYRQLFHPDAIDYTIQELTPFLTEEFKRQLKI